MSVLSRTGIFAFGGQSAKESLASTYYRHKASVIALGATTVTVPWADEIGGSPFDEGLLKTASYVSGRVVMAPRMEAVFGWLAYGLCGSLSTDSDNPESGMYLHQFKPDSSNLATIPWMSMRKWVPGSSDANALGEIMQDCKLAAARFAFGAMAPLAVDLQILGRVPTCEEQPSWSWGNTYEDKESVPVGSASGSYFKLPDFSGSALPTPGATVTIVNQLSAQPLAQEMIIGSYNPDDLVVVKRRAIWNFTLKYADPDLWQAVQTGATDGTTFSASVYNTDAIVRFESPADVDGMSNPYAFEIRSEDVEWQVNGPITLAGNNIVMIPIQGVATNPTSGNAFELRMVNEESTYSWPS